MRNFLMPALMLSATLSLVACSGGTPTPANTAPVANFSITPMSGPAALIVTTANTSSDADAGETATLTYDWNWGDSTPSSTAASPTHTYTAAGTYTVTLAAKDVKNATSIKTATVTVTTTAPVAPTILSVSPADASLGNQAANTASTAGAPIVITFSTPMDVVATQAAYQSASAGLNPGAGNVTFGWSAGNTVLTITPNLPLAFTTQVATLAPGVPISYTYTINAGAKSATGLLIDAPKTVTFSTFVKHTGVVFLSDFSKDATVADFTPLGTPSIALGNASTHMTLGDNATNLPIAAYLTFPLTALPTTVLPDNILQAKLDVTPTLLPVGSPYTLLNIGADILQVRSVVYGTPSPAMISAPVTAPLASDLNGTSIMFANVMSAVKADWAARVAQNNLSQYQIRFAGLTNNNLAPNQAYIGSATDVLPNRPKLTLTYTDKD